MIYEDDASIVIVKRRARGMMRVPMGVLGRRRVVVMVIVVLHGKVDVRRRQERRQYGRCCEKQQCDRPAHVGVNHRGILSQRT